MRDYLGDYKGFTKGDAGVLDHISYTEVSRFFLKILLALIPRSSYNDNFHWVSRQLPWFRVLGLGFSGGALQEIPKSYI